MSNRDIIRIRPFHYLHVKDTNANIVRVITGPKSFTCQQHEQVIFGPEKMIVIPPRHYVVVDNPVVTKKITDKVTKEDVLVVVTDNYGQAVLRYEDQEIRFEQQPFPLYDGEKCGPVLPLQVVEENTALRLKAKRDFTDLYNGEKREAGEEWLFNGRATYYPQVEVEIVDTVKAIILKTDQALKLRAKDKCKDHEGTPRRAGQEWLVKRQGPYLPDVNEEVVETLSGLVLTDKLAIHVKAKSTFTDSRGEKRKAGSEWLVTNEQYETYIPDVHEEVTRQVNLIILMANDYCIVKDPVDETGIPKLGYQKLVRGPCSFFLKPGESLSGNIRHSTILGNEDALLLTAAEEFIDTHNGQNKKRQPGEVWLCYGPGEFWPPVQVTIKSKVTAFFKIEPMGLYYFQPSLFFGSCFILMVKLFVLLKWYSLFFGTEEKSDL